MAEEIKIKKKWYRTWWGIATVACVLLLWGFLLIGSFINDTQKQKIAPEASQDSSNTVQPTATTDIPEPTESVMVSKKITEKIENLVAEEYPNFEVSIWNKNSDLASEGEIPYEVLLNGSFSET